MAQRRIDGLCFNCPEKFTPGHIDKCTMKGIYLMELDDSVAVDDTASNEDLGISLHALTGIMMAETMHLATTLAGSTLRALVDSGSTHSFIATSVADRLGISYTPRPGLSVGVANGERVQCAGICTTASFSIGHERFVVDLYVLQLEEYDLVLGCQWLQTLGPILWDFE